MVAFRYSEWDGTQEIPPLNPDELLESITDDLMNFGDLQHALRNLLQRGMRNPLGQRMDGLRDLLQQLRQQRRSTLDQYNLGSAFEDIERKLAEVLDMERTTVDERLSEALSQQGSPPAGESGESGETGQGNDEAPAGAPAEGQQQGGGGGQQASRGPQASGGQQAGGERPAGGTTAS